MKTRFSLIFLLLVVSLQVFADDQPVYVDVRTWMEHQVDHIDGDVRIHVSEIEHGVSEMFPDKSTRIHLYCAKGVRAGKALQKLREIGYVNAENSGGIEDVRRIRFSKNEK